ncbi:MAG: LapA family protein [Spirochaetaceae bacterium]|nr:LapA family protein [Spirochaetaceae bacterium]
MRGIIKTIIMMAVAGFLAVLIALNAGQTVNLNFIFFRFNNVSLSVVLIIFFVMGFLFSIPSIISASWRYHKKYLNKINKDNHKDDPKKIKHNRKENELVKPLDGTKN